MLLVALLPSFSSVLDVTASVITVEQVLFFVTNIFPVTFKWELAPSSGRPWLQRHVARTPVAPSKNIPARLDGFSQAKTQAQPQTSLRVFLSVGW